MPSAGWRHLFLAIPGEAEGEPDRWRLALAREGVLRAGWGGRGTGPRAFDSIYLAGPGAPKLLADPGAAHPGGPRGATPWGRAREVTLEVEDPGLMTAHLERWVRAGVTRVALAGAAATTDGVATVRGRGFEVDVRLELDGGIPGPHRLAGELVQAGATSLSMAEGEGGAGMDPSPWLAVRARLAAAGWVLPELAHAHAPGQPPRHPRAIRRREPVLGLGPGAVTFRSPERQWNQRDPASYLGAVEGGKDPREGGERLNRPEARLERVWLALRTARGLRCPAALTAEGAVAALLARWQEAGWTQATPGWIRPTPRGWLQADHLATALVAALEEKGTGAPSPGAPVP